MGRYLISVASTANLGADVTFTVVTILLTVAVLLTAVWLLAKFINAHKGANVVKFVVITVAAGVVIRVLSSLFIGGYRYEFTVYNRMIDHFMTNGFSDYYFKFGAEVYPFSYYIFALFGGLGRIFGLESGSAYLSVMIKIPFIIADAASSIILYRAAKRYVNAETGAVLAGVYSLCPVFFTASGIWGSSVALLMPFILGSFYLLISKKHLAAILVYSLAMLVVKDATYLYPLYLIYYGFIFVRSIVRNVREKKAFKESVRDGELSLAYKLPVYFTASFLLKYVVSLPLIIKDYGANPFTFIYNLFLAPLASLEYFSYNGLSIFNIFGKNAETVNVTFPSVIFTVCFGILIAAIICVVYFSKKNRAVLPLLAAYVLYTLATYFLDSDAMSVIPVLALLLLSFVYIKDRRILQVFCLTAFAGVTAALAAMVNGGFMNMLGAESFVLPSYTGSPALTSGFGLVTIIFCSVISVASHLYLTLVAFDITMSNNRKLLGGRSDIGYFEGIKQLFK
ncbi:MAG: hypothetical protein ACLTEK_03890 [Christensenellales bacterium]